MSLSQSSASAVSLVRATSCSTAANRRSGPRALGAGPGRVRSAAPDGRAVAPPRRACRPSLNGPHRHCLKDTRLVVRLAFQSGHTFSVGYGAMGKAMARGIPNGRHWARWRVLAVLLSLVAVATFAGHDTVSAAADEFFGAWRTWSAGEHVDQLPLWGSTVLHWGAHRQVG